MYVVRFVREFSNPDVSILLLHDESQILRFFSQFYHLYFKLKVLIHVLKLCKKISEKYSEQQINIIPWFSIVL